MDEHFLHHIWKLQKFNSKDLTLTNGEPLIVFNQGYHNHDSGPDFEEARVKIGDMEWAGSIEIHIHASDWIKHRHDGDTAYGNVILHVVWQNDRDITIDHHPIPTLELKNLVAPELLNKYQNHLSPKSRIVCESLLKDTPEITYNSMLSRVLVERLEIKAKEILQALNQNKNDWEGTVYQTLAKNFGFSTNKTAFEKLTHRLPFSLLKKNLHDHVKTEALIFGQAGFLGDEGDSYKNQLISEFNFLKSKFNLQDPLLYSEWKFGKMRPANFPSVRLAQFAAILSKNPNLFSKIISIERSEDLSHELTFEYGEYWTSHYNFEKPRKKKTIEPGRSTLDNILINTLSPILAAYCKYTDDQKYMNRAISLLELLKPEVNRHTKEWNKLKKKASSAFDSQAQIQLIKNYCDQRKCLDCNIGVHLLSK